MKTTSPDPQEEAIAAFMAHAATGELREISRITERFRKLLRHLEKFSFPLVAAPLAGLLTRPENHCATGRIEALIHLAALSCCGNKAPRLRHVKQWLNRTVLNDPISQLEVPVEDVFVSNVGTWMGNARVFEGRWQSNADQVQICFETLLRLQERPWATQTLQHIMALLRVSESVADRAGIERNSRTTSRPAETIEVNPSVVAESSSHVCFSNDELVAIGVEPADLNPFLFQGEHADFLVGQSIGHTALERRPLVRFKGHTTVALPTSIGAAIRRFAIEQASAAGDLCLFQSNCHLTQFTEAFQLGRADWDIEYKRMLEPDPIDGMREFVGTFGDEAFVHVLFVPDDFEEIAREGLASIHRLRDAVRKRIEDRAAELARETRCRRGLTVLIHGGIGREFAPVWGDLPDGWHQLCVSAPDFMLLGSETDFTAMRAWKLLQMVDELEAAGVVFLNLRGFLNLAAFAYYVGFELVPENFTPGPIYLHNDLILPLRHMVRDAIDRHVSMSSDGESWVVVERETTRGHFGQPEGRPVFFSRVHRARQELLACAESTSRPWWIQCSQLPEDSWHRDVVFNILDLILRWLVRLVPVLEERNALLPPDPVAFRIRFPAIETFRQRGIQMTETAESPAVTVKDGEIAIDCTTKYLLCFLSAGNLGDRLMIASLLRGADLLCGNETISDADMEELVHSVVGPDSPPFLAMNLIQTAEDMIYDLASLPKLRLLMPEDRAWSQMNLARRAGHETEPGPITSCSAGKLLEGAVDEIWERVRSRLVGLSRDSVIKRSLLNYVAVRKEHRDSLRSMAAQLSLHDQEEVTAAEKERVQRRDTTGLACRVIAEMALCTSPHRTGSSCDATDLDFLVGEVSTLIECAGQRDALQYGLADRPPMMQPNGSFGFDASAAEASNLLMTEHWRRTFLDAAEDDDVGGEEGMADPEFPSAFMAEFSLSLEQYAEFVNQVTLEALEGNKALLRIRKSEVENRLRDAGAMNPQHAYEALALVPRARWDEKYPSGAKARDWWPWRYNRRLSIMRRPLVQLSNESDPFVIVVPSILSGSLGYIHQAAFGDLPDTLFDSPEMAACIGRAANRNGHEFTCRVAARLGELRWKTMQEVRLTRFKGENSLGDIDVLAWQPTSGLVYAVECKSLRFDRTYGEIGERLAEYSSGTVDGERTPLQKHLDRISYLDANRQLLSDLVCIPVDRLQLRSALVTERLVSMQFSGEAREVLDLVTDYELLEKTLPN